MSHVTSVLSCDLFFLPVALDTHSEEIKELTHDIIKCCPKESVSSIASVVDPAP